MRFSSYRMMREYVEKMYLPSAIAYRRRIAGGASLASKLFKWEKEIAENWGDLHFGKIDANRAGDSWAFEVQIGLGKMKPEMIRVELYADPIEGDLPTKVVMSKKGSACGAEDEFLYECKVPADRPAGDYTPRIVPYHPEALVPLEEAHILWHH
jgi:glycogen phosphorylase